MWVESILYIIPLMRVCTREPIQFENKQQSISETCVNV